VTAYFDSSVLVKAYCLEPTSPQALALIRRVTPPLLFTPLHSLEIRNALRLKRHRKEMRPSQLRGALQCLQDDVASGFLQPPDQELGAVYIQAELLSAAHAVSTGARSLDILHVAAALVLKADEFISFDRRQRALATRAGLRVRPRSVPNAS
jgi:predicted nucleic acid-binding protein